MSFQYNDYLNNHIANVQKAAEWIILHFPDLLKMVDENELRLNLDTHDSSKYAFEEYEPYDVYFYGGNRSSRVVANFNRAWLHHIHSNPHHWQYWILVHDDGPEEIIEMPVKYVIEMIADWWSFSFRSGNLREIFDWHNKHKEMKLHPKTRKLVEDILARIKVELDKEEADEKG